MLKVEPADDYPPEGGRYVRRNSNKQIAEAKSTNRQALLLSPKFTSAGELVSKRLAIKEKGKDRAMQMTRLRREGYTLEEIGKNFNLSRERIRQILSKASNNGKSGLLSASQAMSILQCNRKALLELVETGSLEVMRRHGSKLFFRESHLQSVQTPVKRCIICGRPVGKGRSNYCSPECYRERWNYCNWPEERKTRHRKLVEKWHKEHPEQAKVLQARKYQRKLAKLRKFDSYRPNP